MFLTPLRIDPITAIAWCGNRQVRLSAKARLILDCLVTHAGQPVPKDVLLRAAWPDRHVDEDNLKVHIREVRRALGDDARRPRYIETILRLGYRFVAPVNLEPAATARHDAPVGREGALEQLHGALERARAGSATVVVVTGEAGIGKTALCEHFLAQVPFDGTLIARGQCAEVTGLAEPYAPILDALADVSRNGDHVTSALRMWAPMWSMAVRGLPPASTAAPFEARHRAMASEFFALLEALSRNRLFVLVIEDLHWCDQATLRLLGGLRRRLRRRMQVLVIGTCRSSAAAQAIFLPTTRIELPIGIGT